MKIYYAGVTVDRPIGPRRSGSEYLRAKETYFEILKKFATIIKKITSLAV